MNKGVFVLGTDTDIGKTFVSALIIKALRECDVNVGYFKGILSGAEEVNGNLIPGDCKFVCDVAGIKPDYEAMVSYTLKHPYSPHLASRIEKIDIRLDKIKNDFKKACNRYNFILCEGSGGIVCPIKLEEEEILLEDIVKMTKLPTILVARAGLGTINHTILTVKYAESIGISIKGIVLNEYNKNNEIHVENKKVIEKLTKIKNIVCIEKTSDINNINLDNIKEFIYGI